MDRRPRAEAGLQRTPLREAASRYDLATRVMSLGRDATWKQALVASLPDLPSPVCVDLACGTGDVAFLLAGRYPGGVVAGLDLSIPMLAIARERNRFGNVRFERGDLCDLPYPDGSIDVVTGSYALRNAPDLRKAVAEVRRVLSPGGVAAFLDFSNPERSPLRYLQYLLLRGWCGLWDSSSTVRRRSTVCRREPAGVPGPEPVAGNLPGEPVRGGDGTTVFSRDHGIGCPAFGRSEVGVPRQPDRAHMN